MQPRPLLLWLVVIVLWSPLVALVAGPATVFIPRLPLLAYVVAVVLATFLAVDRTIRRLREPRE